MGLMVVSVRPLRPADAISAVQITTRFPVNDDEAAGFGPTA
jgi:uncharacterized protein YcsI (UPF0317 family)